MNRHFRIHIISGILFALLLVTTTGTLRAGSIGSDRDMEQPERIVSRGTLSSTATSKKIQIPPFLNQLTESSPPLRQGDAPQVRKPGQQSQKINRLEQEALRFYREGEINKAVESFTEILKLNPNHLKTLINLGNIFYREQNYSRALNFYKRANQISDQARPLFYLGLTHQKLGNTARARDNLQQFIDQSTNENLVRRAETFLSEMSPTEPKTPEPPGIQQRAPTPEPKNYEERARTAFRQGNYEKAAELFRKAIQSQPGDNPELLMNLASTYFRNGQYTKARDTYEELLNIQPESPLATLHLGATYLELGNKQKAKKFLNKAKDLGVNTRIARKAEEYLAQLSGEATTQTKSAQEKQQQQTQDQTKKQRQTTTGSDTPSTPGVSKEAAKALGQKKGKTEEEQLEETLEETEENFTLLGRGNWKLNYSMNYSFDGSARINVDFSDQRRQLTQFDIERDAQHQATHRISVSYGLLENMNVGLDVPIVQKYSEINQTGLTSLGDMSLNLRYQPFPSRPGKTRISFNSGFSIPTGRSTFEVEPGELSTGGGFFSWNGGINISKPVDPVLAFASFGIGHTFEKHGLSQQRSGGTLSSVAPGQTVSLSMGMAYSLSYKVSLTMQYRQSFSFPGSLEFESGRQVETNPGTSSSFSITTGWRISPEYLVNVGIGIGMSDNAPDSSISLSIPVQI